MCKRSGNDQGFRDLQPVLNRTGALILWVAGVICAASVPAAGTDPGAVEFFEKNVRPVLVDQCYRCHSTQAAADGRLKGELRLDTRQGVLKGGTSGPAVVPGKPDKSLLIEAVRRTNRDLQMPPKTPLPAQAVADLEKWVAMGAPDPRADTALLSKPGIDIEAGLKFWSFQPLRRTAPPAADPFHWGRTPIDAFIGVTLAEKQLRPNPIAGRDRLIRRAYFDLLGVPPTPAAVRDFVNDPAPDAYEKLVDQLLDNPHYGERWARHWLDVARFGESDGFEYDGDRRPAYQYRDFVIRALDQDMPFDRFAQLQIAGDELASGDWQALAATGFLIAGAFPGAITEKEFETARYNELDDMISTLGTGMLGLTVGCARCHDHKFDPIPTADYYRLAATFATTIRSETEIDLTTPAERVEFQGEWETKVAEIRAEIRAYENDSSPPASVGPVDYRSLVEDLRQLQLKGPQKRVIALQVGSEGLPPIRGAPDEQGFPHFYKTVFQLRRGDANIKTAPATSSFPHVLMRGGKDESYWRVAPPAGARTSYRRAALARWLTDTDYGAGQLLARVIVNRLWQHHFGRGLVATPNDFGAQGERPTHPELLDWLAADLIDHGWKLKRLHKLMMTSSVYMQEATTSPDREAIDPNNSYLWRWQPRRLEAEAIRDSLLAVGGTLDGTMFGPGTLDPEMNRRSVYFTVKRSRLIPMMMVLDWPEPLSSTGVRPTTTVAPQALLFMNSPQTAKCAEAFARRIGNGADGRSDIEQAYQLAFGRAPQSEEIQAASSFIARQESEYRSAKRSDASTRALVDFCQALMSSNEFVYVE